MSRNVKKRTLQTCTPSEDSDHSAYSRSLIIIYTGRMLDKCSLGCKVSSCGQGRLWSNCANAQSDLSLRWAHARRYVFSRLYHMCTCSVNFPKYRHLFSFRHQIQPIIVCSIERMNTQSNQELNLSRMATCWFTAAGHFNLSALAILMRSDWNGDVLRRMWTARVRVSLRIHTICTGASQFPDVFYRNQWSTAVSRQEDLGQTVCACMWRKGIFRALLIIYIPNNLHSALSPTLILSQTLDYNQYNSTSLRELKYMLGFNYGVPQGSKVGIVSGIKNNTTAADIISNQANIIFVPLELVSLKFPTFSPICTLYLIHYWSLYRNLKRTKGSGKLWQPAPNVINEMSMTHFMIIATTWVIWLRYYDARR